MGKNKNNKKDQRFSSSDARFKQFPKRKAVLQADDRFSKLLTDANFSTGDAKIDEKGRRQSKTSSKKALLKQTYRLKNDQLEELEQQQGGKKTKSSSISKRGDKSKAKSKKQPESESSSSTDESSIVDESSLSENSTNDQLRRDEENDDESASFASSSSSSSASDSSLGSSYDLSDLEEDSDIEVFI